MQRLTVKPIEDPAEQAALDERLKRSQAAMGDDSTLGDIRKMGTEKNGIADCHRVKSEL